ncbi:MAG: tRNA threonylcarbamoyladenosine dehydratase [Labilithrix sp.]|nr:tRNA threonylcarbamoyladenosine dehydratase [Labilithrix sp.]MCW5810981.1 tRNA threonylcarbamoyladenosine dehydratase [Labilithrix sp.]
MSQVTTEPARAPFRLHRRFDRLGRLYGDAALERLSRAHVLVIGLGGVGSFAVEALARSGVGRLTLVDFDRVCVTNTNRQLQALSVNVAKRKADVLAERAQLIDPRLQVQALPLFYGAPTANRILRSDVDFAIDATDNVTAKCHLLAECRARGLRVVTTLGSAGRTDPLAVTTSDLAKTKGDVLAADVRRVLRHEHGFPMRGSFGVRAVWSTEPARDPSPLAYDGDEGFHCVCPGGKNEHHSCEERVLVRGSASFVTGTFGLVAASVVVNAIARGEVPIP